MLKQDQQKSYPHFTPGNKPNRAQRRKDCGINKRGIHKPKDGRIQLLVTGELKWKHFIQHIPLKDEYGNITGFRKVTHTSR